MISNASTSISLTPPSSYSRRHPDWKPPSTLFFGVPTDIVSTKIRKKRIAKENDDARKISISHEDEGTNNKGHVAIPYKSLRGWTSRYEYGHGDGTSFASKLDDSTTKRCMDMLCGPDGKLPQKLRNMAVDPRLIELISNEIMDTNSNIHWDDIAGLHHAKKCVKEMGICPLLRPDVFEGSRSGEQGLPFFGPPGTGKTMTGKAIAAEAKVTFFYISASSLYGKWRADSQKLVRALFGFARCRQPAVIFVDEIDSIFSKRTSKRVKTEFYKGMEGIDSGNEQVLVIGSTNRPQDLDEAARRRLTKRFYIPLPCSGAIYNGSKWDKTLTALRTCRSKRVGSDGVEPLTHFVLIL